MKQVSLILLLFLLVFMSCNISEEKKITNVENRNSASKVSQLIVTLILVFTINLVCLGQDKNTDYNIIYKTGNPADWPAELDAVVAAPHNHKILLENDQVRVLEVFFHQQTEPN
nr:hypothetical protein [uncultured Psychroserpens sp.]